MDVLKHVLLYVGPTDVLDIVATSILIYYVLLLLRGTRAVQILIGVLVLVALLALSQVLHLYLLGSILQVLVVGAAVTLPIVFQPELRRALEQLGRGGLFRIGASEKEPRTRAEDRNVSAIVRAAFSLSGSRTGALIVLEQSSGLREFAETGTLLDARLSADLLLALFSARSPLHDGATIVRDDIVEAAGCFLPLTEQTLMQRRIGSRHRAALGLTEQTDAVVVVVSEEVGAVTVARQGKLSLPVEDEAHLLKMLLSLTRAPRQHFSTRNDLVSHLRARLMPRSAERGEVRGDHPTELRT